MDFQQPCLSYDFLKIHIFFMSGAPFMPVCITIKNVFPVFKKNGFNKQLA